MIDNTETLVAVPKQDVADFEAACTTLAREVVILRAQVDALSLLAASTEAALDKADVTIAMFRSGIVQATGCAADAPTSVLLAGIAEMKTALDRLSATRSEEIAPILDRFVERVGFVPPPVREEDDDEAERWSRHLASRRARLHEDDTENTTELAGGFVMHGKPGQFTSGGAS